MTETIQIERPSLLRRLAAIVYDTFLVLPLVMLAVAVGLGLRIALGLEPYDDSRVSILDANLVRLIELSSVIAFFCYFWLKNGQTLSMQAWRMKLINSAGGEIRFYQVVVRALGAALSALCLGAGYWWCLIDTQGKTWHDYLSGTELILLPKKEKAKKAK